MLTTDCLEPNLWMGCAYFAILAIKRNNPRFWLWFGVVAGLGLFLSAEMARALGGDLRYEPAPAGGARFEVVLPC